MSAQLSKMHVRFIQSQKNFHLLTHNDIKGETLPITHIYVKDNSSFYLLNQNDSIADDQTLHIRFTEPTSALNTLDCTVNVQSVEKGSDTYDDALLFFNVNTDKVTQLLLLNIQAVKDN
jgi:hypothetical protein